MKQYCNNNDDDGHERFNGELADVLKSVRGLKKQHFILFSLLILHHNFIRPHMSLNEKTPSESAGITIKGPKLLTLIENAAVHQALAST